MRVDKRTRELRKNFKAWTVERTKNGHIRLTHRITGAVLIASRSPSDWRSDKNLASQARSIEREGKP